MQRPRRRLSFQRAVVISTMAAMTLAASPSGIRTEGITPPGSVGGPAATSAFRVQPGSAAAPDTMLASERGPLAVATAVASDFNPNGVTVGLSLVKSGFTSPILVTNAGDGSGRLFVVEQAGVIRVISGGNLLATPFLDLRGSITSGGEQGLLGLAFHPDYPTHPYVYVDFTDRNGNTAIDRFTVSADPNVASRTGGVRLMTISQPYPNHNGGNLAFGPDGDLYIGMGDGGSAGDPGNRAQDLNSLLGKMLRIDVNHTSGTKRYRSPATNPYVGRAGLDEIWSRGLRNPWRWSFDRLTGQLWIADVGQDRWEEIDRANARSGYPAGRGVNFGWNVLEGRACYKPASGCSTSGKQPPLAVYAHSVAGADNCAVTGGFVYRGSAYPALAGGYLFGDYCSGRMWVVSAHAFTPTTPVLVRDTTASPQLAISSFGEDEAGELYVCDLTGGSIYRVTATAKP